MMKLPLNFNYFSKFVRKSKFLISSYSYSTMVSPCGQPTAHSHPYLLKQDELIPGFKVEDFIQRRQLLMNKIGSTSSIDNNLYHAVIIPSASKIYMTEKIPYIFRQNTDFFYFTGCLEPDSILLIHGYSDEDYKSELFVKEKDVKAELWDGPRTGTEIAPQLFSVDRAHPTGHLEKYLEALNAEHTSFYLWYDNTSTNGSINTVIRNFLTKTGLKAWNSPRQNIHKLRLYKSNNEQEMMRKTCRIGCEGLIQTIASSKPGTTEQELFTKYEYEVRMRGAQILAYPPVVASGNNANIIHYISNNQICADGDLLLIDAGCELNGYDSDITRTWPINGSFNDQQKVLYEIVLDTQLKLLKICEQLPTLDQIFSSMCDLLGKTLVENHIVKDSFAKTNDYSMIGFKFCPHHSSHYLGMDVHDCATIPRTINIEPGMIFTVEPGVYINKNCKEVHEEFHGLGIRIEDDILIDKTNNVENLTELCPKTVKEIESLIKKR